LLQSEVVNTVSLKEAYLSVQPFRRKLTHVVTAARPEEVCSSLSVLRKPTMIFVCFCTC